MFTKGFVKTALKFGSLPVPPRMNASASTAHLHRTGRPKPRSTKPGGVTQTRAFNTTSQLGGVGAI